MSMRRAGTRGECLLDGGLDASIFSGLDLSWLGQLAWLLMLPLAHQDLAIVAGAYIIVNNMMPTALVAASIYGGIVASDFALYGIGAGARHIPWLSRFAIDERVLRFSDLIK